jgi:putative Mg2+ transporter-C (MgtC) family protein
MRLLADIPSVGWDSTFWRLLLAAGLGAAIGLERELDDKAAGLRTHMLVSVGSALFTLVSAYGFHDFLVNGGSVVRTDPSRIAAQIVTGVGFLGAGVIFRQGFTIRGLTTAATLWLVAAIGMAAGAGFWEGAVIATGGALVSLRPLEWVKNRYLPKRALSHLAIELIEGTATGPVVDALEQLGNVVALRREGARLEVEFDAPPDERIHALDELTQLPQVREARWSR